MGTKKWITGEELLTRWGMQPFELVEVMLLKEFAPVDPETGRAGYERWDDGGVCFYCCSKERVDRFTVCSDGSEYEPSPSTPLPPAAPESPAPDQLIVRCRFERHEREDYRADLAIKSTFSLSDVQAFEQAHGLKQFNEEQPKRSKKQVAQDFKTARDDRIERLFEKANVWAENEFIQKGRRMIHDELFAFLNRVSDESVSDNVEKTIWKRLPQKARNGPGRRRGGE